MSFRAASKRGESACHAALVLLACVLCAGLFAGPGTAAEGGTERWPTNLRVGASGDYAPFSKLSSEGAGLPTSIGVMSHYRGFDADIARRFAEHLRTEVAWIPFRWADLVEQLERGEFDVAMSGVTVRPERSVAGRFSVPVADTGAVVLVRASAVTLPPDQRGQLTALDKQAIRIGVNRGGHLERVTRGHFTEAKILAIPDNAAVRTALAEGRVEAVVTDTLEAPGWARGLEGVSLVGPFTRDRKAYLMPREAEELAARLDAWLLTAERDGVLAALREEHFGADRWPRAAEPLAALLAATDERLALMPFVADFKRRSGRDVVDEGREERVLAAAQQAIEEVAAAMRLPAPSARVVREFYRAQIDAAIDLQRAVLVDPEPGHRQRFDLAEELRPALLRIGERMARLLVETSRVGLPADFEQRVRAALSRHGLSEHRLSEMVEAVRAIGDDSVPSAAQPSPAPR